MEHYGIPEDLPIERGVTMNKRWIAAVTAAAVAGLGGLLSYACRPPQDPREACLEEGLADLATVRWIEPRLSGGLAPEACEKDLPVNHAVEVARCPSAHRRFFPV